jgi:hypothetical protein
MRITWVRHVAQMGRMRNMRNFSQKRRTKERTSNTESHITKKMGSKGNAF